MSIRSDGNNPDSQKGLSRLSHKFAMSNLIVRMMMKNLMLTIMMVTVMVMVMMMAMALVMVMIEQVDGNEDSDDDQYGHIEQPDDADEKHKFL